MNDTRESLMTLVAEVERYIVSEAKRAARKSGGRVDSEDLAQVGRIAALKQAERFDPTKGFKFVTFALERIRREIRRAAVQGGSVVQTSTVFSRGDVSLQWTAGDDTETTLQDLLACEKGSPEDAAIQTQADARVRAIVDRVKWERFAEKARLFDDVVARLVNGSMTAEKFTSEIGLAEIAAKHGLSKQAVSVWESKIRSSLSAALSEA